MNLRLGQRVKKVRGGFNLGTTGVVWMIADVSAIHDFVVRTDQPVMGHDGILNPAGSMLASFSEDWEPIITDREPSEMSYEELMEDVMGVTVPK